MSGAFDGVEAERHPSYGVIEVNRVSQGGGGAAMFDSDIRHSHYVILRLHEAERQGNLSRDWIRPRKLISELRMSFAQWGPLGVRVRSRGRLRPRDDR